MKFLISGLAILAAAASPAAAEVRSAEDNGFTIGWTAPLAAPPDEVWAALGQVGRWWNGQHSWSGDAANLTLGLAAGGCFCETLPKSKGSVEHMRVVFADPDRLLRLTGALGPLQSMPLAGVMEWTLKPAEGGSELSLRYTVSGAIPGGGKGLAPAVDAVLGEQFGRLKAFAEKR